MNVDLIISSGDDKVDIALLHDKQLVEFHRESTDKKYLVGDIYLGRAKKLVSGLNAAFVNVGYTKDAFLHYLDLGPQFKSFSKFTKLAIDGRLKSADLSEFKKEHDIDKGGKITDVMKSGYHLLVQVTKEPISTKGPRISTEISLPGRYLVLMPFSDRISVSSRIRSRQEKERLKRLVSSIKPEGFGVIIRTVAQNRLVAELDSDLKELVRKWELTYHNLKGATPPVKVLGELDRSASILRDLLNEHFNSIIVNDPAMHEVLRSFMNKISPDKAGILKLHKSKVPVFDEYGINRQIKALFGRYVNMKSGAYLIIEHTEAMHVVDVNSGNTAKNEADQESSALSTNMEAAKEIARQLRLRDMGGIIVVDFIDMQKAENRKKLHQAMKDAMKDDRARHNIIAPSRFGVVQITRQRVRPEMEINTAEKCPSCGGSGEVRPSILIIDEIENNLEYLFSEQKEKKVTIVCHPFVAAYLNQGFLSIRRKLSRKYGHKIRVKENGNMHFLEFQFLDYEGKALID